MKGKYFVVKCPECHRYFPMKWIKSTYKKCPSCSESIRWQDVPRRKVKTEKQARNVAVELNEKKEDKKHKTALDYLLD
jgi:PHP family Zn ribbon phosphoesterase